MQGEGDFAPPATGVPPQILSRSSCDLAPLALADSAERAYLAAFVWADQPARLQALKAGISALLQASSNPPLSLEARRLPEELPAYLAGHGFFLPCMAEVEAFRPKLNIHYIVKENTEQNEPCLLLYRLSRL